MLGRFLGRKSFSRVAAIFVFIEKFKSDSSYEFMIAHKIDGTLLWWGTESPKWPRMGKSGCSISGRTTRVTCVKWCFMGFYAVTTAP